jgi:NDP-sugar pyrophosphorylase family protein
VGWETDAYWLDIGRPDDYERAQTEFMEQRERFGWKA